VITPLLRRDSLRVNSADSSTGDTAETRVRNAEPRGREMIRAERFAAVEVTAPPLTWDPSGPNGVGADPLVPLRNSRSSPILGRAPSALSLIGKPDEPHVEPTGSLRFNFSRRRRIVSGTPYQNLTARNEFSISLRKGRTSRIADALPSREPAGRGPWSPPWDQDRAPRQVQSCSE